jgi:hypothetical protein
MFHLDVAHVCICCKCFKGTLQVFLRFVKNILYVPDICYKRFDLNVTYVSPIYCNNMFQIF